MEVRGEVLYLHSITRSEMGSYMCVAKNGVPPAVSKIVQLNVNCKYWIVISLSTNVWLNLYTVSLCTCTSQHFFDLQIFHGS